MRRLIWLTATAVLLLGAGVAVAHDGGSGKTVKAVTGTTFTATSVSNSRSTTCKSSDGGSYVFTRATYTGTSGSSSEPSLNGNVTIAALSSINTTTNVGTVSGRLRIDGSNGTHTNADFDSVYSGGSLAGLAEGRTSENGGGLLANLSAGFSATGGFTDGKIGGTAGGGAVLTGRGDCQVTATPKPDRIDVHGVVTAISPSSGTPTSISAAGVTCSVPSTLAAAVGAVHVGDSVELQCTVSGGTSTLTKIEPWHQQKGSEHSRNKH
jgi:hypothetical protein